MRVGSTFEIGILLGLLPQVSFRSTCGTGIYPFKFLHSLHGIDAITYHHGE